MQSVQAQPAEQCSPSELTPAWSASRRLRTILSAIQGRQADAQPDAAPGYEGYAWCDSSEAQLNMDIATCRRTWLR
jgi:hypothetical protein